MYGLWRQIRALLGPEICQLIYNNDWRMLEADKSCRDLLAQLMTYAPKMHDSMIKALGQCRSLPGRAELTSSAQQIATKQPGASAKSLRVDPPDKRAYNACRRGTPSYSTDSGSTE